MCSGEAGKDPQKTVKEKPERLRTRSFESRWRHTQEAYEPAPPATRKQVDSYYDRTPEEDPDKNLTEAEKMFRITKRY